VSAETIKALEEAIEAHMADAHGDSTMIVQAYILQAAGRGIKDNRRRLSAVTKQDQDGVESLGLLSYLKYGLEEAYFPITEVNE